MLEWFAERVSKEVAIIRGAPTAFMIAVLFVGGLIYVGLDWLHSEKYETQDQRISYLSEQIQFQKNETSEKDKSIEDLKNQLDLIQKQIGDLPKEPVENTTPEKEKPESKNVPDSAIQRSVEQARRGGVY